MCGQTRTWTCGEFFLLAQPVTWTPHGRNKAFVPWQGGFVGPPAFALHTERLCWAYRRLVPRLARRGARKQQLLLGLSYDRPEVRTYKSLGVPRPLARSLACLLLNTVAMRRTTAGGGEAVDEDERSCRMPCVSENTWCSHQTSVQVDVQVGSALWMQVPRTSSGAEHRSLPSNASATTACRPDKQLFSRL